MKMRGLKLLAAAFICVLAIESSASAAPIVSASTSGPDSSFSINFAFNNLPASTEDITSIVLDGSTANAFPILWDSLGTPTGPAGATVNFAGVDTQIATITFGGDGFNPGETLLLSGVDPDGDPGPAGVTIGELEGVGITFNFSNGAAIAGQFVDDPATGAGLVFEQTIVPEPASLAVWSILLLAGISFVLVRRRRMQAVSNRI